MLSPIRQIDGNEQEWNQLANTALIGTIAFMREIAPKVEEPTSDRVVIMADYLQSVVQQRSRPER